MPETSGFDVCDKCGKRQEELEKPLKSCKCGKNRYCSRECERNSKHRKTCARLAASDRTSSPESGSSRGGRDSVSGSNPPASEIEKHATQTVELMEALTRLPGLSKTDPASTEPPVLRHTFGFLVTTFNEYWGPILQPLLSVELSCRIALGANPEELKKGMLEKFDELERVTEGGFDRHRWPDCDREKYTDALGRLFMSCQIVLDDKKRKELFGGEGFDFGEDVKSVALGIIPERSHGDYTRA